MSYQDFQKAMALAPKCEGYYSRGGTTEEKIKKAEEMLGIQFSRQCREFYEKYNYISFAGYEIEGINPDSSFPLAGNAVATALKERKESGLPEQWMPLHEEGFDGLVAYMDYSQLNAEGEPRIIEAVYTSEEDLDEDDDFEEDEESEGCGRYIETEVLAEDIGEYLLSLVEEALEDSENEEAPLEADNSVQEKDNEKIRTREELEEELRRLGERIDETLRQAQALEKRTSKWPWLNRFKK